MEAIDLLGKHSFQAVLSFPVEPRKTNEAKHLHNLLAEHIRTGGTLILATDCLSAPWRGWNFSLNGNFDLEGHDFNDTKDHYVLNPSFEDVFGPSIFASLDTKVCTNLQLIGDFPDSAKIYRSALKSRCPAAFVKHDNGYIGYLVDMSTIPALRTLLLAMLGRLWIIGHFSGSNILMRS